MRKIVQCSIIGALGLAIAGCAGGLPQLETGPTPVTWRPVTAATGQLADVTSLEDLARAFPDSGSVQLSLLNAYLGAEDLAAARARLDWLAQRGYRFSDGARAQLVSIFAGSGDTEIAALTAQDELPLETSELVAEVPSEALLVEGIAVGADSGNFAVTTVVAPAIWRNRDGQWKSYPLAGLGNLSGIAVDPVRGTWLAAGDLGMLREGETGFAGLVNFGRDPSGPVEYPAPAGVNLSDIALGAEGSVYASDPIGGGIYRFSPAAAAIEELVPPGTFRSPQGLAESADGSWLYVSDYRYGLAAVDLETRRVRRVTTKLPILLDGIDALIRHGDELVAVQNGSSPMQIVALELGGNGLSITGRRILERSHSQWTEPLGAAIHGNMLYYVATGQWDRFDDGGALKEGLESLPTAIRAIPLGD